MRKSILIFLIAALLCLTSCSVPDKQEEISESFFAMDTHIKFTAYGANAKAALSKAKNKITELEHLWSVTDEKSEIYAVNHANGKTVTVSDDTANILDFVLDMAKKTDGALDPTIYPVLTAWGFTTNENRIPQSQEINKLLNKVGYSKVKQNKNEVQIPDGMMLDLGAVGKGYAGDVITELLKEQGITSALLDIGGNIQVIGTKPDGSNWRLGIRDPFGDGNIGILNICDKAVVTSGSYERYFVGNNGKRYGHIIDTSTGYPAESGLASAIIIANEGKIGDALSTSLYIMGLEKAIDYWKKNGGFDMILITDEGEIYFTEEVEKMFSLDDYHKNMKIHLIQ